LLHPVIWTLSLLLDAAALNSKMMLAAELRCHCIQTAKGLMSPKHLANVEIIPKGPHCHTVEIIATLKNSQQICLDPQANYLVAQTILKTAPSPQKNKKNNQLNSQG
uniref:C-X-C motif chemokine n=1 Tax=Apteryx owenii TaxID=8824 RepID=A0A8B9SAR6_APTOW